MATPTDWRFNPFTESYAAVLQSDEDRTVPASGDYWIRLYEVPREDSPSTVDCVILVELNEDLDAVETGVDVVAAEYGWVDVNDVLLVDSEQMLVTAKPGSPTLTVTRGYNGTSATTHTTGTKMEILNSLTEVSSGSPAAREYRVDYKYNTGLVLFNSAQAGYNVRFDYWGLGSPFSTDLNWPQTMIAANAIGQTEMIDDSIGTGELKTAQASGSVTAATVVMGSSAYAFYPAIKTGVAADVQIAQTDYSDTGSYKTVIYASAQTYWLQAYVTASPPYRIGQEEWGHFLYLLRNSTGEIKSIWEAPDPPWADHPSWLGKDDFENIARCPHPFPDYWQKDPAADGLEIVLVDLRDLDVRQCRGDMVKQKLWSLSEYFEQVVSPPLGNKGIVKSLNLPNIPGLTGKVRIKRRH